MSLNESGDGESIDRDFRKETLPLKLWNIKEATKQSVREFPGRQCVVMAYFPDESVKTGIFVQRADDHSKNGNHEPWIFYYHNANEVHELVLTTEVSEGKHDIDPENGGIRFVRLRDPESLSLGDMIASRIGHTATIDEDEIALVHEFDEGCKKLRPMVEPHFKSANISDWVHKWSSKICMPLQIFTWRNTVKNPDIKDQPLESVESLLSSGSRILRVSTTAAVIHAIQNQWNEKEQGIDDTESLAGSYYAMLVKMRAHIHQWLPWFNLPKDKSRGGKGPERLSRLWEGIIRKERHHNSGHQIMTEITLALFDPHKIKRMKKIDGESEEFATLCNIFLLELEQNIQKANVAGIDMKKIHLTPLEEIIGIIQSGDPAPALDDLSFDRIRSDSILLLPMNTAPMELEPGEKFGIGTEGTKPIREFNKLLVENSVGSLTASVHAVLHIGQSQWDGTFSLENGEIRFDSSNENECNTLITLNQGNDVQLIDDQKLERPDLWIEPLAA